MKLKRIPKEGRTQFSLEAEDAALAKAKFRVFRNHDYGLHLYLLGQAIETFKGYVFAGGRGRVPLEEFANTSVHLLNGIQPADEVEAMLAVQMVAIHNAAMEMVKRAMITRQTFQGEDACINAATKMLLHGTDGSP